ncbi:hypothetical protein [Thioclava sp. SK-1]|uniref:hypothetical protein n=1 Tax=Thioclava sp. SK-1 TaxID=1889770 RepID=UPI00159F0F92|nr:hypothetical protein [Thioclava sp. SK-1]
MPLPHFLLLIFAVIVAAAISLWAAAFVGVPLPALAMIVLLAAGLVRMITRVE